MESIDGILAAKLLIVFSLFWFGIYFLSCMLYSLFLKLKKENKNIKEKKDNFSLKALILFTILGFLSYTIFSVFDFKLDKSEIVSEKNYDLIKKEYQVSTSGYIRKHYGKIKSEEEFVFFLDDGTNFKDLTIKNSELEKIQIPEGEKPYILVQEIENSYQPEGSLRVKIFDLLNFDKHNKRKITNYQLYISKQDFIDL